MTKPKELTPEIRKQIGDAVKSGRVDDALSSRLKIILSTDDASLLERGISFLAQGNPVEVPQGLYRLTGDFYSGYNQTYAALVGYVNLQDAQGNPAFNRIGNKNL